VNVEKISLLGLDVRDASGNKSGEGRTAGLHLGEVVRYIMTVGMGKDWSSEIDEGTKVRFLSGFVWEVALEVGFAEWARRGWLQRDGVLTQVELEKDEILMTPDAIDLESVVTLPTGERSRKLEQYKFTYKSSRRVDDFEGSFDYWLMLDKAYCHAANHVFGVEPAPFLAVDYHVLFAMSDWAKGKPPAPSYGGAPSGEPPVVVRCSWSMQELEEHWQMILGAAESLRRSREG
jgi:hypothetical protein